MVMCIRVYQHLRAFFVRREEFRMYRILMLVKLDLVFSGNFGGVVTVSV
ncbi:MAG: hypothetical protein PWP60_832 [Candidatus Atribacteria bacterium]|nr:hypothetical protein [Candidatus Atribacteria bacterium]